MEHESTENAVERPLHTQPGILVLTKDKPLAWMVMPEVIARVERFCKTYAADSDPAILRRSIEENFIAAEPGIYLMAAIADGRVVGHMLAYLAMMDVKPSLKFVIVSQYEIDEGSRASIELLRLGFELIEDWAISRGAVNAAGHAQIQALPLDEKWERGLKIFYNFKPYRTIMRRGF